MFEFLKGKHGGEGKFVEVDDGGNLLTARYVPDYAQLVALGLVWGAQETSATASVVAKPTTTAAAALYNDNEPDSQIDLVVFGLTATAPASAAQLAMAGLVYVVQKEKPSTKPINDITVRSPMNSPNKNYAKLRHVGNDSNAKYLKRNQFEFGRGVPTAVRYGDFLPGILHFPATFPWSAQSMQ